MDFVQGPLYKTELIAIIIYYKLLITFATTFLQAAFQDHPWYLFAFNYFCEFSFYLEVGANNMP